MARNKDIEENLVTSYENVRRRNYAILYLVTGGVFLLLVVRALVMNDFDFEALVSDVFGNMMGAIPALLLFDIFYQKLNEENDAAEATKRFTDAIMSNPDNISLFKEEQRREFLRSNIESFHTDADVRDMLSQRMEPYLDGAASMAYSAVRTRFNYDISLFDVAPEGNELIQPENAGHYYFMQQKLAYKIKYMAWAPNREIGQTFYLAFPFGNRKLDEALRESQDALGAGGAEPKVVFSESLDLAQADIDALLARFGAAEGAVSNPELLEMFKEATHLSVKVNTETAAIDSVKLDDDGIVVVCKRNPALNDIQEGSLEDDFLVYDIRVIFSIPRLWGRPLAVFMMDPTKAPKISVSYPPEKMAVEMTPYLSTGEESSIANSFEQENGLYDVSISSEWMYPVSGMVFDVRQAQDAG